MKHADSRRPRAVVEIPHELQIQPWLTTPQAKKDLSAVITTILQEQLVFLTFPTERYISSGNATHVLLPFKDWGSIHQGHFSSQGTKLQALMTVVAPALS